MYRRVYREIRYRMFERQPMMRKYRQSRISSEGFVKIYFVTLLLHLNTPYYRLKKRRS